MSSLLIPPTNGYIFVCAVCGEDWGLCEHSSIFERGSDVMEMVTRYCPACGAIGDTRHGHLHLDSPLHISELRSNVSSVICMWCTPCIKQGIHHQVGRCGKQGPENCCLGKGWTATGYQFRPIDPEASYYAPMVRVSVVRTEDTKPFHRFKDLEL